MFLDYGLFTLAVLLKRPVFCLTLCQWWRVNKRTEWVETHSVKKRAVSIDTMLNKKRAVLIKRQV